MADSNEKQDLVLSVDRAVDILIALNKAENKTIREMSTELDISKSTLHRIIQTLEYRGLVKRNELTEKYSLGYKILELAEGLRKDNEIREIAHEYMKMLSEQTGDTVQLATVENEEILIVDTVEGTNNLRLFAQAGQRYPLTYGNFGKVFLSEYNDDKIEKIIQEDVTQHKKEFMLSIEAVRKENISVGIDNPIQGAISVAVPVKDNRGNIIASVSIVSVKTAEKMDTLESLLNRMKEIGESITGKMK